MKDQGQIAPGSRVRVRDEDWLVRRIDRTSSGQRRLEVTGISSLVRNREALFLEDFEESVELIDPRNTVPVVDPSPNYRDARLHLEFLLRESIPSDHRIHAGHRAAMDVVPYQLDPAHLALQQPRQRILIADAVGLGKTIECGVLLSELIRRGRGRRILVLTVKSMLTQFQKELWARFSIPLTRLDSAALQRIRTQIPANHNPFHYFDRSILSIDTIKQDGEYRNFLESGWWDVIVIDEAHNVAQRSTRSMRHRVAQLLSERSDSLILLSATPHDGRKESFASIMNMLDPTAIKDPKDYGPEEIEGLFIRRFKKDIQDQVRGAFPQRETHTEFVEASSAEEKAYEMLANLHFSEIDRHRGGQLLFRTLLEKALFSSPAACIDTIDNRIKTIRRKPDVARFQADIDSLQALRDTLDEIDATSFSKFQLLVSLLKPGGSKSVSWSARNGDDRLVIFTERIPTLEWLSKHLPGALGLKHTQFEILHGGLSDIEQQEIVERFGTEDSKVRVLLASDVASEGINLHYLSHRLIHFDIPWSLLTFQQRNGRVDRYGQEQQPQLYYLLTRSSHSQIRGDQRILEILIKKDDQVQENIGDPSEFTGFHSVEDEELEIGKSIENRISAEEFDQTFGNREEGPTDDPFLARLLGGISQGESVDASVATDELTADTPSLFADEYEWAKSAFDFARHRLDQSLQIEYLDDRREIHFTLPEDFRQRTRRLPPEIFDRNETCVLTSNRESAMKEISVCRKEEGRWPKVQLLWEQHPVMGWLRDKVLGAFARNEVPTILLPTLGQDECIILCSGLIPNRKGHPIVQRWVGASFKGENLEETLDLEEVLEKTGFARKRFPNPESADDPSRFGERIPDAIEAVRSVLSEAKKDLDARLEPLLQEQLARLREFRDARDTQLEMQFEKMTHVRKSEQRKVKDLVSQYERWIEDTLRTENNPSIQLAAVFAAI